MLQENASNLSSYKRRLERLAGILKFQELLKMYPVPVKVVKNENGFHITDCVWSTENCTEGPDTCECYFLFNEPEKYFIVKQLDHVVVRDGSIHHKDCLTKASCQCGRENTISILRINSFRSFILDTSLILTIYRTTMPVVSAPCSCQSDC
ncbi:hypothetical protein TNCV_193191 [Trichonephila clavipes]|nr:hypothetical protein TNCV_193191 [Trichonephila clavipes]